jgi:hypothetical protein
LGKKLFLQLDLDHALLSGNLAHKLQEKWRSYGTLWAGKVRTQPIELDIPRSPKASQWPEHGLSSPRLGSWAAAIQDSRIVSWQRMSWRPRAAIHPVSEILNQRRYFLRMF